MRVRSPVPVLAGLALAAASCSSERTGTLSLHLADAPGDYLAVNLHVLEVQAHGDHTGWVTLGRPDRTYDLLSLRGGIFATLVDGATLPAGDFGQVRLLLGADNTVRLADGTVEPLTVPSGLRSGLKLVCRSRVDAGAASDLFIDFDGHRSIFLHGTGAGRYLLRPVVRCVEKAAAGAITGTLTRSDGESTAPVAGATVTAQVLDAAGNPTVVNAAVTRADGSYTLGLLPLGATYHVVTQPVLPQAAGGTLSYPARASGPIALTAAQAAGTFSAVLGSPVPAGGVGGAVISAGPLPADLSDEVRAIQPVDAGGVLRRLVIRSAMASVGAGGESYALADLPAGTYALDVTRRIQGPAGETVATGASRDAVVAAGATTALDLEAP